jgi:hypothetical protein
MSVADVQDRRADQLQPSASELTFGTAIHISDRSLRIDNYPRISGMIP